MAILPLDGGLEVESLLLAQRVRSLGASSEIVLTGNMSKKLKKASKLGAQWAWMLGRAEAQEGVVLVKNLETGDQKSLTVEAALTEWKSL